MLTASVGLYVRVQMIVKGLIRSLLRMVFPFGHQRCVHAAMLALFDRPIWLLNYIAIA
jgi:hypothetical protein